jgi:hypothetical protein
MPLKPSARSAVDDALEQRERAVVEFHDHAVEGLERRLISMRWRMTVVGPNIEPEAIRKRSE